MARSFLVKVTMTRSDMGRIRAPSQWQGSSSLAHSPGNAQQITPIKLSLAGATVYQSGEDGRRGQGSGIRKEREELRW